MGTLIVTVPLVSACPQDLENQMHIAEQKRRTLLKDFHDTWSGCYSPAPPPRCPHTPTFASFHDGLSATLTLVLSLSASAFAFSPFLPLCLPPPPLSHNVAGWQKGTLSFPFLHIFNLITFWLQSITFPAVTLGIVFKFDHKVGLLRSFWKRI